MRGRGRGAAGGTPQPDASAARVTEILRATGEHISLVVEHVIQHKFTCEKQYTLIKCEMFQQQNSFLDFCRRPLLCQLQRRYRECRCSPFGRLLVRSAVISGSSAERLFTFPRLPANQSSADSDIMIELGPVHWIWDATTGAGPTPNDEGGSGAGPVVEPAAARLQIAPTDNPGFVLLLQEHRDDCAHREPNAFRAEHVRQLITDRQVLTHDTGVTNRSINGPACSYTRPSRIAFHVNDHDDVPCLRVPVWWFSDELFTRHREHNWPPEAVLDDIHRFGLHLVPVGAPSSATAGDEWRLSFSRAELLLISLMTDTQMLAAIALKACKSEMGEAGKVVKSYYVKTALLWLCEKTPSQDWTGIIQGVYKLLDFLDNAVSKGNLPCFFWSRINLLQFVNRADRRAMKKTLATIRKHLMELWIQELCAATGGLLDVIPRETRRLTEHEVRLSLVRWHLCTSVYDSVRMHITFMLGDSFHSLLPVLMRTYQPSEVGGVLGRLNHRRILQKGLWWALAVAPDDVVAQMRLSDGADGGLVWDAAPLLSLLTDADMRELLGEPDAVSLWLRRQHRRPEAERPPGLPADLSSARDRCDLLLNTPLLCTALRESVPWRWAKWLRYAEELPMAPTRYLGAKMGPTVALQVLAECETLQTDLQARLGMDSQTAKQTALPVIQWAHELLRHPETLAEHTRVLPDWWELRRFMALR